jgi:hypothetical protein
MAGSRWADSRRELRHDFRTLGGSSHDGGLALDSKKTGGDFHDKIAGDTGDGAPPDRTSILGSWLGSSRRRARRASRWVPRDDRHGVGRTVGQTVDGATLP